MTLPYETQSAYETSRPAVPDNVPAIAVYVLYGMGYFNAVTVLVGLVVAYVKIGDAELLLRSHYRFQIRTFWISLLYLGIGLPLSLLLIGFPIVIWWFAWSLVRTVKGVLLLIDNKPIVNPESWLFG
jgi:uncharacterized membrane protein